MVGGEVGGVFPDQKMAAQHLLLFVSALIPKAMASLMVSAVIELSKSKNVRIEVYCGTPCIVCYEYVCVCLCVCVCVQLALQDHVKDDMVAEHVMLEAGRLWPPFFGGARVCTEVRTNYTPPPSATHPPCCHTPVL